MQLHLSAIRYDGLILTVTTDRKAVSSGVVHTIGPRSMREYFSPGSIGTVFDFKLSSTPLNSIGDAKAVEAAGRAVEIPFSAPQPCALLSCQVGIRLDQRTSEASTQSSFFS